MREEIQDPNGGWSKLREGQRGLTQGDEGLHVPWPLPQGQLGGVTRALPFGILQKHRFHSASALFTPSRGCPVCTVCLLEPRSRTGCGVKWAAFFFIPLSPKQFSKQAFVCPRCSRLCSDLILPIYSPFWYLFIMFYFSLEAGSQRICHIWYYLHLGKHNRAHALSTSSRLKGLEKEKN